MERKEINILRKIVHQVGIIYKTDVVCSFILIEVKPRHSGTVGSPQFVTLYRGLG